MAQSHRQRRAPRSARGRYFECQAQAMLMSGYLGSIGFSLPAAMGAWAATREPDTPWHGRPVVSISGDGGFGQYMGDLTTLVKYGMNITHVLLNNGELGKISKEQRAGSWDVWQTSLHNPNFAEFATNCGALGIRVAEAQDVAAAVERALAHPGPALVEVLTDVELICNAPSAPCPSRLRGPPVWFFQVLQWATASPSVPWPPTTRPMTPFDKKFGADFLASVPSSPGVYRFLNRAGTCVYVGKAKDLRARLGQYRNAKRTRAHRKMRRIVKASSGLEVEVTATEAEALLLENTLIQTLRPRLNVDGAFTFLYPTIGIKRTEHHLHVAYSTQADDLKSHGFRVYGCYRNRRVSRAGFDALVSILTWLGHPEGAEEKVPYTTWRRFRQIAPTLDDELASLLLGKADTFLQSAILGLVDKPAARRDSAEVQASVKALKRFFDTEGFRLARLRASSGLDYIPHDVRDQAMINSKHPLQSE